MVSRRRWGVSCGWPGACSLIFAAALALGCQALQASTVIVQPINVCGSGGLATCGDPNEQLYTEATNAIWAQAGITVDFLSWETAYTATGNSLDVNSDGILHDLFFYHNFDPSHNDPLFTSSYPAYAGDLVISMWFVSNLDDCGGSSVGAFGCSLVGGNEIAIGGNVFTTNRIDTIAHEIGHSLGLYHCGDTGGLCGASAVDYLMEGGGDRTIPTAADQIGPTGLDRLSPSEIARADSSSLDQVPEPGTVLLTGIGILGFVVRRRRAA